MLLQGLISSGAKLDKNLTYGVVLGRHELVWEELERAKDMMRPTAPVIIATKRAGRDYDGFVHHWVSFHPNLFMPWMREREAAGRPPAGTLWAGRSPKIKSRPNYSFPLEWLACDGGSSGLLGVMVGLHLKIDKLVLCGIPMEQTGRYDDNKMWKEALVYQKAWREVLPKLKGRVKSFSGWTRALLGEPTEEWLNEAYSEDLGAGTSAAQQAAESG